MKNRLRIGILGAARIAPDAVIKPARKLDAVEILAVAARDRNRAAEFAAAHGIPRVHDSYDALLGDPDVDLVYNPLPNSLHCRWSIKALEAGRDVLCEKPLASNMDEALLMREAARKTGRTLIEAFHYRYHPLMGKAREAIGRIGAVKNVELCFSMPLVYLGYPPGDIRYKYSTGGGATMDLGCYCIDSMRFLTGMGMEVTKAKVLQCPRDVDLTMRAEFTFSNGAKGGMYCSFYSLNPLRWFRMYADVKGEKGRVHVNWPFQPQITNKLTVYTGQGKTSESVKAETTYYYQLKAVSEHILNGAPLSMSLDESIQNMKIIDEVYRMAGLRVRGL